MPKIGDVDVIITDPLYNSKPTKAPARRSLCLRLLKLIFDSLTERQFIEFCGNAVTQAKRWVVMSCAWQHAAELERAGVPLVRFGIWHKPNGAPQFTGDRPGTGWEGDCHPAPEGKKRWNGGGYHAVWVCNVEHGDHPEQKPLNFLHDWVAKFTEPGENDPDPFMEVGTTGVAWSRSWPPLHRHREAPGLFRPRHCEGDYDDLQRQAGFLPPQGAKEDMNFNAGAPPHDAKRHGSDRH